MKARTVIYLCIIAAVLFLFVGIAPERASAVPSFAKQTGRPCSGCHTIWPRLNVMGREFKIGGYTDVADEYERIQGDNLDLLRFGPPLSLNLTSFLYQKDQFSDQKSTTKGETRIPDEAAFYFAGRITPNIGTFTEFHWTRDSNNFSLELVKIAAATRVGESNTVGIVAGKMDVAGADPYNTIRYTAFNTINTPALFTQTRASGNFFQFSDPENMGVVLNGKFFQKIYAAVGGFRGDGGAYQKESDPIDYLGRLVFEYPVTGESIASVGGFYYSGKERYDNIDTPPVLVNSYLTTIKRYGADFQWQTESAPNIFEAVAVYMQGDDKNVDQIPATGGPPEVKFKGFYTELSYFYQRMYGVTLGYDYFNSDQDNSLDKKGPTVNFTYSPWLNTKFVVEYSSFKHSQGVNESVANLMAQVLF